MDLNSKMRNDQKKKGGQRRVIEMADLSKDLQKIRDSANPRVKTNLEEARRLYKQDLDRKSVSPIRLENAKSQERKPNTNAQAKIDTGLSKEEK